MLPARLNGGNWNTEKRRLIMRIIIGSDKSGFSLKEAVRNHLIDEGFEVVDGGTQDLNHVKPYFVTAPAVAARVSSGEFDRGILVCGTGAGMEILANKYKGVYAVVCNDIYDARMCRAINDANIITMGGWKIAPEVGIEMADIFLSTDFTQDLEPWRQDFLKDARDRVREFEKKIYG